MFSQERVRRLRRWRRTASLRALRRETRLSPAQLIQPVFVAENPRDAGPIDAMPGVYRVSLDTLSKELELIADSGLSAVLVFGIPARKDANGSIATDENGIVPRAVRRIKERCPQLAVITDVCVCSYTDHGHCGVVRDGRIVNDETVSLLERIAVAHAAAGADVVAPSAMMDHMVAGIRRALDDSQHDQTGIMSYAVKYASSFYGPFREAADSTPRFGDRRSYQMDPANVREALAEAASDVEEGADVIMVKPALAYLDVISAVRSAHPNVALAAYQVSGEYSMIKSATQQGWLDERRAALETLTAIRRAGADMIITYWAREAAHWLREGVDSRSDRQATQRMPLLLSSARESVSAALRLRL